MKNINEIRTEDLKRNYRFLFETNDGKVVLEHLKRCFGFLSINICQG